MRARSRTLVPVRYLRRSRRRWKLVGQWLLCDPPAAGGIRHLGLCPDGSGTEVAPYFNRLENDVDYGHLPYHGDSGPIPCATVRYLRLGTMDRGLRRRSPGDAGHPWAEDHNAPGALGVSPFAANIRDGIRISTGEAYLRTGAGNRTAKNPRRSDGGQGVVGWGAER